ncbi:MAG: hypothetical protein ACLFPA_12810 [Dichotomicrobium sp.]
MAMGLDWETLRRLLEVWNDYLDADDDMAQACLERFEAEITKAFGIGVSIAEWKVSLARRTEGARSDDCYLTNGYRFGPAGDIRFTLDSGETIRVKRQ